MAVSRRGLSPRVRSHPVAHRLIREEMRSISACAESSTPIICLRRDGRVYLRVCGVILVLADAVPELSGLSPRVRSHLSKSVSFVAVSGSISACAESSHGKQIVLPAYEVYLRVCGVIHRALLVDPLAQVVELRSISACAESSEACVSVPDRFRVYLRVCGVIAFPDPSRYGT